MSFDPNTPPNPDQPIVVPAQSIGPVPPVSATVNNTAQDSLIQPAVRNGVRYVTGGLLTLGGGFLLSKGLVSADMVEPEDIERILTDPTVAGLMFGVATGITILVEHLWLKARKLGKAT